MANELSDAATTRRAFLSAVGAGSAALAAAGASGAEPTTAAARQKAQVPQPTTTAEATDRPADFQATAGGDFMVDVLRHLKIDYIAATPGNTFMGIHEGVINYGMVTDPKLTWVSTLHEEASVAMAHGYAKIACKPMACIMHSTVGLQHGSMALYNAYADRAPIVALVGAHVEQETRKSAVSWAHAVNDGAAMVRDFIKWDDAPDNLTSFATSTVRGYKFAMTPPQGPVLIAVDQNLQERPIPGDKAPPIDALPRVTAPIGELGAVREIARQLVAADMPVLLADRCARTPVGLKLLVELAELLQAPVCDLGGRMNFPWRHPLNQSMRQGTMIAQSDFILALEVNDFWGATHRRDRYGEFEPLAKPGVRKVSISAVDLFMKSNYQSYQRFPDVDLAIAADAEATLPYLIEEVRRLTPSGTVLHDRGQRLAAAQRKGLRLSRETAASGWDASPISVPRLCVELYAAIRNEDWSLVNDTLFQSNWPQQLWNADRHHRYIGGSGAYGIGYTAPAALGAALANREHGRITVSIQGDGDLMFGPGILWTAAHETIPMLYVMHNNRSWHNEIMQMQAIANRRQRGVDRVHIGTNIDNPNIDFAMMARSMGVHGEGPITDPTALGPALRRAVATVKRGEPALVDIVSQGR